MLRSSFFQYLHFLNRRHQQRTRSRGTKSSPFLMTCCAVRNVSSFSHSVSLSACPNHRGFLLPAGSTGAWTSRLTGRSSRPSASTARREPPSTLPTNCATSLTPLILSPTVDLKDLEDLQELKERKDLE